MNRIQSFLLGLSMMSALGMPAPAAAAARFDHYDPAALNERALRRYEEGDRGAALILLERAHLLAPHDRRIARNLEVLRALQRGQPLPQQLRQQEQPGQGQRADAPAGSTDPEIILPPGPLWQKPN